MKKIKYFLYILLLIGLFSSCANEPLIVMKDDLTELVERAYFEGQRDALENDVRIKRTQDSCWIWTDSPWDNGKPPIYDPSYLCK